VVCAGTGLNIAAQTAAGEVYVYGNYIPMRLMGGLALGGSVIDAAAEAEAGIRPATALTGMLLEYTGYKSFEALFTDLTTGKYEIANQHLVPGLLKAALENDTASVGILDNFVKSVALYTEILLNRMGLADKDTELVYSGGIFKNDGKYISNGITEILRPLFPKLRFVDAELEPVCGAMLTALEKRYNNIPVDVLDNFKRDCEILGLGRE
jgi:N-acetylglucosamine kinase-like BadF-type ATPase